MSHSLSIKRKIFPFLSLSTFLFPLHFSISVDAMEKDTLPKEREETSIVLEGFRPNHNLIPWEKERFGKSNLLAAYTLGTIYQKRY